MAKKKKTKVGIKKPTSVEAKTKKETPVGKPPKRIRMLISCANHYRAFSPGDVLLVPQEVSVNTARSWIASGAAEEDKSLDAPKEKKVEEPEEKKVIEPEETKEEAPPETKVEEPGTKETPPETEEKK